ncbi:MAG: hypothetical protein HIU57_02840 [Acidobacteria bacterium]|nr:hypothetical protein [Acidobacteriota bacterium]
MNHPRVGPPRRVTIGAAIASIVLFAVPAVPAATAAAAPRPPTAQSVEPPFGQNLDQRMSLLFHDIVVGSLPRAATLFFPKSAYIAMKTGRIASPSSDYEGRLAAFFRLDVAAYRAAILAHGPVTFLGVNAAARDAQWIRPGWCENSIGYWHEPGVRLVYRHVHVIRSVAVASLISWRGVWYVVHLGPNPRPRNVGTVDSPALGRGVAGPAGGC